MITVIILLVVGIIISLIGLSFSKQDLDERTLIFIFAFFCVIVILPAAVILKQNSYKQGQVDAMNGKYKYERHLIYPENDTIPCDTLYVKTN